MKELEKCTTWAIIHELHSRGAELTYFDDKGKERSIDHVCVNGGIINIRLEVEK